MLNKVIQAIQLENFDEARALLDSILRINSKNSEALRLLSIVYAMQGDGLGALTAIRKVIKLDPKNGIAHSNHGNILRNLGRCEEAITSYKLAINFAPEYAEAHNNLGNLFQDLKQYSNALPHYLKAIEIDSSYAAAYSNLGNALSKLKKYDEALTTYIQSYQLNPDQKFLLGNILHHKMLICDWSNLDEIYTKVVNDLRVGKKVIEPFSFQGISNSEEDLFAAAKIFSNDHFPPVASPPFLPTTKSSGLIRIGYVCGEFREHATSRLMVGVYEQHDKSKFEVFAFHNGIDDGGNLSQRMQKTFDGIINIRNKSTIEVVDAVKNLDIDILVNLNGFYGDGRQDIFAHRAAPIQVNYLGFPGTIGADYMDYLIADNIVIPESSQQYYSEKISYLPGCYQANDSKCPISDVNHSRHDLGLPEDAFVFCCFNNNYKITPKTFDSWMRILSAVSDSVLWLIEDNETAASNLRLAASIRGISPDRIIFASRIPIAEHLARHRQANLFLDTLPYNAHTTASDALWSGLPVLTCKGNTFPGRVAASLLKSLDLQELIVESESEYEEMAIHLALNPSILQALKNKLSVNARASRLFDTSAFTRQLEGNYLEMIKKHLIAS